MTNRKGFTLIETLVYLALFAILITGLLAAAYGLFESTDRNQTKAMLQEEENFLIGKINWTLGGAATITDPAVNASSPTLSVTKYDGSSVKIQASGNNVLLNGNTLNNSNVAISHLVFIYTYAGGTNPESVEAGFTTSAKTPHGVTISHTASTTRYIRK